MDYFSKQSILTQIILPVTEVEIFTSVITLTRTTGTVSTVSEDCLLT